MKLQKIAKTLKSTGFVVVESANSITVSLTSRMIDAAEVRSALGWVNVRTVRLDNGTVVVSL